MHSTLVDGSYSFSPYGLPSKNRASAADLSSNALQTVLLTILLLIIMGIICSLSSRMLHKIILWFAPTNGTFAEI